MEEVKGEEVDVNDYKKLWTEFLRVKERVLEEDERRYRGIISEIEKKPVHFTKLFPEVCPVSAVEDVTSYIIDFFKDEFVDEDEYEILFSKISRTFKDYVVGLFAAHLEVTLEEGYGSDHEEPHITYYREIIRLDVDYEDIRSVAEGMSYELEKLMKEIIIDYIEEVKDRIKKHGLRDVFDFDGEDEKFAQMVDRWVVNLKDVYEEAFNNVFLQMDPF
jgi:esterase/lipase